MNLFRRVVVGDQGKEREGRGNTVSTCLSVATLLLLHCSCSKVVYNAAGWSVCEILWLSALNSRINAGFSHHDI